MAGSYEQVKMQGAWLHTIALLYSPARAKVCTIHPQSRNGQTHSGKVLMYKTGASAIHYQDSLMILSTLRFVWLGVTAIAGPGRT